MRVCVISFDYWGFDSYIIKELQNRGIEASPINLNDFSYKYPSIFHKIGNAFNKAVFKKNIKSARRQEFVLQKLEALGPQDIILSIRPDLLEKSTHLAIKGRTKKYYAYLYDSTKRFPVNHLLKGIFDKVFSFDEADVMKYGFTHISNYIYLPKQEVKAAAAFEYKVFMVVSGDDRLQTLNSIADKLDSMNVSYKFIVRASRKPAGLNPKIEYRKDEIWQGELMTYLDKSEIFLDIIRHGHNGLSFRVFEAMAFGRKLITTNQSIKNYGFYNPDNILVLDSDNIFIDAGFLCTPYQAVPEDIYNKYTIRSWVQTVFFE